MHKYQVDETLDAPAEDAFTYLQDVTNLPHYFPRMTKASVRDDGDVDTSARDEDGQVHRGVAHFEADSTSNTLTWSSAEGSSYEGSLSVESDGDGQSRLTLELNLEKEIPGIEDAMSESLRAVAKNLEKDAD